MIGIAFGTSFFLFFSSLSVKRLKLLQKRHQRLQHLNFRSVFMFEWQFIEFSVAINLTDLESTRFRCKFVESHVNANTNNHHLRTIEMRKLNRMRHRFGTKCIRISKQYRTKDDTKRNLHYFEHFFHSFFGFVYLSKAFRLILIFDSPIPLR